MLAATASRRAFGARAASWPRRLCSGGGGGSDAGLSTTGRAVAIGATAGGLGSLVGLGGGFVAVPMLTGWAKLTQHVATGTSLAVVLLTGATGAYGYASHGNVAWDVAAGIALGGMVTARYGARLMHGTDANRLKLYMGCLQMAVAPLIPLKTMVLAGSKGSDGAGGSGDAPQRAAAVATAFEPVQFAKMLAIGGASGFMAGMFGVGGGALTVPAIALSTDLGQHAVVGSSLAAMLAPAMVGTATNLSKGNLNLRVAGPLAVGSAIGASAGASFLAPFLPEAYLQALFSVLMATLGMRTVRSARAALRAAAAAAPRSKK